MEPIRVLVADDEEGVRDVLGAVIASDPTLTLVGSAAEADSAIALATEEQPDVALVDVRMPGGGGLRAAKEISRRSSTTKIIAVSAHEDSDTVLSMLLAGASGYVAKSDPTDEILRTIHRTLEDRPAPGANEIERVLNTFDACREHLQGRSSITDLQHRRIERALHRGSMSAELRPIGDLRTGEIAGADATAAFRTGPDRSVDAWFAEARAVGKHVPLELSLVREALSEIDRVPDGAFIAVSVSPDTICSPKLRHTLEGAQPDRVVLAISEQEPIHDDQAFDEDLFELRDGGIRIAIDDAGTGHREPPAPPADRARLRPDRRDDHVADAGEADARGAGRHRHLLLRGGRRRGDREEGVDPGGGGGHGRARHSPRPGRLPEGRAAVRRGTRIRIALAVSAGLGLAPLLAAAPAGAQVCTPAPACLTDSGRGSGRGRRERPSATRPRRSATRSTRPWAASRTPSTTC